MTGGLTWLMSASASHVVFICRAARVRLQSRMKQRKELALGCWYASALQELPEFCRPWRLLPFQHVQSRCCLRVEEEVMNLSLFFSMFLDLSFSWNGFHNYQTEFTQPCQSCGNHSMSHTLALAKIQKRP